MGICDSAEKQYVIPHLAKKGKVVVTFNLTDNVERSSLLKIRPAESDRVPENGVANYVLMYNMPTAYSAVLKGQGFHKTRQRIHVEIHLFYFQSQDSD